MSGLKILYRSLQEIPPEKWMEKLELEAQTDAAEAALGYPLPRRLRPLFSAEHSHSVRVEERVFESYADFGKKIKGFDRADAVLTGFETRTSAPIRIERGNDMCALLNDGVYPCGEGAGYAGGITSAAIDGIRCAQAITAKYKETN